MSLTPDLIGKIIQHCGLIELHINTQLKQLSKDDVLSEEIVKSGLHRRADVLGKLLERDRHDLSATEVKEIIASIKDLGNERNIIAHNPHGSKNSDLSDMKIYFYKKGVKCEYTTDDVKRIFDLSLTVLEKMQKLKSSNP